MEVKEVLGDKTHVDEQDLEKLQYTEQVRMRIISSTALVWEHEKLCKAAIDINSTNNNVMHVCIMLTDS